MMQSTPPPPDEEPRRLHCRRCGYNVGPTADWTPGKLSRCPECGDSFDAALLSQEVERHHQSAGNGSIAFHLLWPAGVVFLSSLIPIISLLLMPLTALLLVILTAAKAGGIAERLAYTRPGLTDDQRRRYMVGGAVVLWLCQVALMGLAAFGGCSLLLTGMQF